MRRFPIRTFVSEGPVGKFGPKWVSGWWDAVETDDRSDFTHWSSISPSRKWQLKGVEEKSNNPGQQTKTHSSGTPVFPELNKPSCLSMCGLGGLAVRGCQSLFQTIDGALRGGSVSLSTFAFATTGCIPHFLLHNFTSYISVISFVGFYPHTLTHSTVIVFMQKRCKHVKSFWNACVFQQLHFNYRFLRLQCQLRLLILNLEWSGWVSRWMLKVIVVTWVLSLAKKVLDNQFNGQTNKSWTINWRSCWVSGWMGWQMRCHNGEGKVLAEKGVE